MYARPIVSTSSKIRTLETALLNLCWSPSFYICERSATKIDFKVANTNNERLLANTTVKSTLAWPDKLFRLVLI